MIAHSSNAEQERAWNGDDGLHWARNADRYDRCLRAYTARLLDAAAIAPEHSVLDVGCGSGPLTREAARRAPAGRALGVDLSAQQLELARERAAAESIRNVEFLQADAQIHAFAEDSVDVVISRLGTMFFADPVAAFANLARATRPDGRLAILTWQPRAENEWMLAFSETLAAGREVTIPPPDAPGPLALSDPQRVRSILGAAGWTDVDIEPVQRRMFWGDTVDDAFEFIFGSAGWRVRDADEATRERGIQALRDSIAAHCGPDGVSYASAAWLVQARRAVVSPA
jgi:SAM-dependent methyltransferase